MEKIVTGVLIVVYALLVPAICFRIARQSHRPSFAGSTGGNWENLVGHIIPLGTPWPAKAEDYSTTLKPTIETKVSVPEYPTTSHVDKTSDTTTTYNEDYSKSTTSSATPSPSIVLEHKPSRPSFAGSSGGNWQTIPTSTSLTSTTPSRHEEDSKPTVVLEHKPPHSSLGSSENSPGQKEPSTSRPEDKGTTTTKPSVVLEYQPNRPSFAGATGGNWENLVGQLVPSQNSSLKPEKDNKLSYVHISLKADDIKAALGNHNASQFFILALNLSNLKEKSGTDSKPEDVKKQVEQFLAAEKTPSSTSPVLSILLNVDALKSVLLGT